WRVAAAATRGAGRHVREKGHGPPTLAGFVLREVPVEPGGDALPGVDLVLSLVPAVALARVEDELGLAAGLDERVVELDRLGDRRAEVVLAVEDQRRRRAPVRVVDRRAACVLALPGVRVGVEGEPV